MRQRATTTSRREFIQRSAAAGVGFWVAAGTSRAASRSANEKLNIAVIGAGGKGHSDAEGVNGENIVALCDVDDQRAAKTYEKFPNAARYKDFRKLLEERKDIDAVVVSTPDHTHTPASIMAMKLGKHVYCQKPLTHDVYEARRMREVAKETGVATQMGNQGTSEDGLRRAVEIVRDGAIGGVHTVYVWTNRPGIPSKTWWPQGMKTAAPKEDAPAHLDWNLWLGPAPTRPYNHAYVPFAWRGWWDFGTGSLGDMACHTANMPFMALKLAAPAAVEAEFSETSDQSPPASSIIRYEFPARDDMPAVKLIWSDAGQTPPAELVPGHTFSDSGCLLMGDKGMLFSPNDYGAKFVLLPEKQFADYKGPEPSLPRSPGHYQEWIAACKGGPAALSNFDHAAPFTEAMLLGNVAIRVGRRIEWDAANMRCKNCPEADQYIRREPRKGWEI